ncbi:hypothetical protein I6A60_19025 [Frankia sp. AgB1.9]|uniref:hypothetical protein n=1 Tax=unclassified Frankia TaxID=2632575 RepID=UPI0019332A59|nr:MULTISPECIES: hypothetical protein [unclassified Frankia]MBL7487889.1 hypothetical protein [Frankia sp. AgW1.1]MBL7549954.1 hypothetical protein [Frankia sp. AgB1.9]MBL7621467.1 hypothetical protein [Frankia sp. AgB1.8]
MANASDGEAFYASDADVEDADSVSDPFEPSAEPVPLPKTLQERKVEALETIAARLAEIVKLLDDRLTRS